ncbi:hypothetical protein [Aurantiacibacter sp. D1-12]|uniref:hypothetical protein n=1 Tax=Aurantiacibacter sp. D1-12 TaxID=2993658 RepID=UPI00237C6498|nr:hypothetical protein [Aurantiacibacter sp. D1-12]MDE1468605.1 hypothetical protein [Aurantiacibacter sp. D1-12]
MTKDSGSRPNRCNWRAVAATLGAAMLMACSTVMPAQSQESGVAELGPGEDPTYADLVTFALASDLVAIVQVDDAIAFPPERAPDVPASRVRLYIESLTQSLLASDRGVGESLVFVTDTDRESDGDVPDWEDRSFVIFADQSTTRPNEVQLVSSRAMFPTGPVIEARVRRVLRQLAASDAPQAITGLRDVISIAGNLAGESETQMFVETASGAPVSLTVLRRPGMEPQWGVSLGEIVDTSARPPERESLAWFRFACSLPADLPADAFLQSDRTAQQRAREDYAFVLRALGPCERRYS